MIGEPDPNARIVFTYHADFRLVERSPDLDLDQVRDEIVEAILSRRVEHRARNIWYIRTRHDERCYPVALHPGTIVVMTVLTSAAEAAA